MAIKTYKDKMVHSKKTTKKIAHPPERGSSKSVTGRKTNPTMVGKK
ncbi:MAG: hypothetical protein ACE5KK_00185 [Candidatus Brocadiales bacterium]